MKILELTIKGYKAFNLNNIKKIHIDFTKDFNLILGTNGSGKSSLLRAITPEPATRGDYNPGGYIILKLEYNGSIYLIESNFKSGARYSFIKDGNELNGTKLGQYGTGKVQKELVNRELKYSSTIHRLLIGDLKFTKMTPAQRRDILSTINPVDFTYVTGLWDIMRGKARDYQGVVKHLTVKSVDGHRSLNELNYDDSMVGLKKDLEIQLNKLVEFGADSGINLPIIDNQIDILQLELEKQIQSIVSIKSQYAVDHNVTDMPSLNKRKGFLESELLNIQLKIKEIDIQLIDLYKVSDSLSTGELTVDQLKLRVIALEKDIKNLSTYQLSFDVSESTVKELNRVGHLVFDSILEYPDNVVYGRDEIETNNSRLLAFKSNQLLTENKLQSLENKLKHYKDEDNSSTCPKCNFQFSIDGLDLKANMAKVESEVSILTEKLTRILVVIKEPNAIKESMDSYVILKNKITSIRHNSTLPHEFWDGIGMLDSLILDRNKWNNYILKINNLITNVLHSDELTRELNTCKESLEYHLKYNGNHVTEIKKLEDSLTKLFNNKDIIESNITSYELLERTYIDIDKTITEILSLISRISIGYTKLIDGHIVEDANRRKDVIYQKLTSISNTLKHKELLENNMIEADKDLQDSIRKRDSYSLISEHLSPIKGLIADQMVGFINSYIGEMNKIIATIWEYELMVGPCDMDNGKLDYKFPLLVEGSLVSDVGDGSSGQCEVIDLAFTIVMREYLNLNDYPLYLDETGATFDETHRDSLMYYIKNLFESNLCSQVFMVNHYAATHGMLSNHNTIVLDDTNITTPDKYNQNVTIN